MKICSVRRNVQNIYQGRKCFGTKSVEKNEPILYDKYLDCTSPGFSHNNVRGRKCTMNIILRLQLKISYKMLW